MDKKMNEDNNTITRNQLSIGSLIKSYRRIMGKTQQVLADEMNAYLREVGVEDASIIQSNIVKLEQGTMLADSNVIRYITDKVLISALDQKLEIFNFLELIIDITNVPLSEIPKLFELRTKSQLESFIKEHLIDDNYLDEKINRIKFEDINKRYLMHFSNSIFIDAYTTNDTLSNLNWVANSTATLVLYLVYLYIQKNIDDNDIIKICTDNQATNKKELIILIDQYLTEFPDTSSDEDKFFVDKFLWKSGSSNIFKSKRASILVTLFKYGYFLVEFMPDFSKQVSDLSNSYLMQQIIKNYDKFSIPTDPLYLLAFIYYSKFNDEIFKLTNVTFDDILQKIHNDFKSIPFLKVDELENTLTRLYNNHDLEESDKLRYFIDISELLNRAISLVNNGSTTSN